MIKDQFTIYDWNITVLYECSCDDIDYIIETLKDINCPNKYIKEALYNLESSVIIVNKTSTFSQLINTIAHEYYHLICHIAKALKIEDEEELAYLNGDLNMRSYQIVEKLNKSEF